MMMIWNDTDTGQSGISVTVPDRQTLLDDLRYRFEQGKGFSVATLNLDHVVKLRHNPAFCKAYAAQTHVTADGNPIAWLSRLAGQKDVCLVSGDTSSAPVRDSCFSRQPLLFRTLTCGGLCCV